MITKDFQTIIFLTVIILPLFCMESHVQHDDVSGAAGEKAQGNDEEWEDKNGYEDDDDEIISESDWAEQHDKH